MKREMILSFFSFSLWWFLYNYVKMKPLLQIEYFQDIVMKSKSAASVPMPTVGIEGSTPLLRSFK